MTKRLIWNFEISSTADDAALNELTGEHSALKWEARYFWLAHEIITLNGLNDSYLNLSRYTYKHHEDTYFLLKSLSLNIKKRRDKIFYKPLLATLDYPSSAGIVGFGKKINLHSLPTEAKLPGLSTMNATQLLEQLKTAPTICVTKEVVMYTFPSNPIIELELSRLCINTENYFSLCLQGNSIDLIQKLATHLLKNQVSCQYVNFLQQINTHKH